MDLETETINISFDTPSSDTLLPVQGEVTKPFKNLVNLPSQIECKECYALSLQNNALIKAKADEVRQKIEQIKSLFGKYPITAPMIEDLYPDLVVPEEEIEKKVNAAIEEYHTFVMVKMLEIISTVLPVNLNMNIMGIDIDVIKFFSTDLVTDEDNGCYNILYSECVKLQVRNKIDIIWDQIPDYRKNYDEYSDTESLSKRVQVAYDYMCEKIKEGIVGFLKDKLLGLISQFQTIWNNLHLPAFPDLSQYLNFNLENYIKSLTDPINAQITSMKAKIKEIQDKLQAIRDGTNTTDNEEELKQQLREYNDQLLSLIKGKLDILLNMQIFGYKIKDIMGIIENSDGDFETVLDDNVDNTERKIEKLTQSAQNFVQNYIKKLINDWMSQVQAFFDAIGLGSLFGWVNFSFKDFLQYLGIPLNTSVDVPKCPYQNP